MNSNDNAMIGMRNAEVVRETAIVEREDCGYVALSLETDIAREGASAKAQNNLAAALSLFFDAASAEEVGRCARVGALSLVAHRSSLPCAVFVW